MHVAVAVAQTPVTWDIGQNLTAITSCLADARPGEIVVLPEACLSGYDDRLSGLDQLDPDALARGVDRLAGLAADKGIHLFCGSLLFQDGAWWNAALYLSPYGTRWTYRKVNLATHERGRLAAGTELPVLRLRLVGGSLAVGVQLCREIVFPEQWRYLAEAGAAGLPVPHQRGQSRRPGRSVVQPPDQPRRREPAVRHRVQRRRSGPALPQHGRLTAR
jgi:predicted amidohydrolase